MPERGSPWRLWRLGVKTTVRNGTAILLLEGRLGHTTAGELEAVTKPLVDQGVSDLVLDLAGVDYISSGALAVLEGLESYLSGRGGRLTLRNPSVSARLALDLAGLLPAEPDKQ